MGSPRSASRSPCAAPRSPTRCASSTGSRRPTRRSTSRASSCASGRTIPRTSTRPSRWPSCTPRRETRPHPGRGRDLRGRRRAHLPDRRAGALGAGTRAPARRPAAGLRPRDAPPLGRAARTGHAARRRGLPARGRRLLLAHPSLPGFLHDRTGRPWRATGAAYGGTFAALLGREATDLEWHDLDLARMPTLKVGGERLEGTTGGAATLKGAAGEGTLEVHRMTWPSAARFLVGAEAIPIDATVWWTLAGGRLALDAITANGAGVEAKGIGSVRLAS